MKRLKKEKKWEKGREVENKGGKGEKKREGMVGKLRGPKACHTTPQTPLEFCLPCPVHLCTKSDHVRTASEKKQKKLDKSRKMHIFEQREHGFVNTNVANHPKSSARQALGSAISGTKHKGTTWDRQRSCKIGPTTAKKTSENATKLSTHSSHHCPNSSKIHQKHSKNDKLMFKIRKTVSKHSKKTRI